MSRTKHAISEWDIQTQLDAILKSKVFSSNKYQQLLIYLIEKSLKKEIPKESTIAIEHYQMDLSKESDTSFVRVAVYHLRKHLKEYYLTDGKNDKIKIIIEKGSYGVKFRRNQKSVLVSHSNSNSRLVIMLNTVIFFLIAIIVYLYQSKSQNTDSNHLIRQDLTSNNKPILIVLGDLFMYRNENNDLIRDSRINRLEDLDEDDFQFTIANQSQSKYLSRLHTIGIFNISGLLNDLSKEVNFRIGSELTIEDFKENNIIFIGFFKTFYLLDNYFKISKYQPVLFYSHFVHKPDNDTISIKGNPDKLHTDYGIFSRVTGPEDNFIYIIAGFTDTSVEMISSEIMKPQFIEKQFSGNEPPSNFEILFEVDGYNRKQLSNISIVSVNKIEDVTKMWK